MALTPAEKQARYRERVNADLEELEHLRTVLAALTMLEKLRRENYQEWAQTAICPDCARRCFAAPWHDCKCPFAHENS